MTTFLKTLAIAATLIATLAPAKAEDAKLLQGFAVAITYGAACDSTAISTDTYRLMRRILERVPKAERDFAGRKVAADFQSLGSAVWCASMKPAMDRLLIELNASARAIEEAGASAKSSKQDADKWCAEQTKNMSPMELTDFAIKHRPFCDHWYWSTN
jgi:hypothetical protein